MPRSRSIVLPLSVLFLLAFSLLAWLPLREVSPAPFPFPPSAPLPRLPFAPLWDTPWPALAAHLLAAGLFGATLLARTRSRFLALAAAALVALHPCVSEVLAAPPHRPLALAQCLFSAAALALFRRPARPSPRALAAAFLLAGAALAVLVPSLVAGWRATSALYASDASWTFSQRLFSAPWLFFRALRCLLVPWPLNVAQPILPVAPFSVRFWIGLAWTALAVAGAIRFRRGFPALAAALALLLAAFLPFSALLFPLPHPVADRYLCFMVPPFALAVAAVLSRHPSRGARVAGALLLCLLFGALLRLRLHQWRTPETLLAAAAFQNPLSPSLNRACADLCDTLGRPGDAALFRAEADRLLASPPTP